VKTCVARTVTSSSRPLRSVQATSDDNVRDVYTDTSLQRCRRYWEVTASQQYRILIVTTSLARGVNI